MEDVSDRLREIVDTAKSRPCADCKVEYPPWVMQFDHRPGYPKLFEISQYSKLFPGEQVLRDEMAKCDVVCANCHAQRTHDRNERRRGIAGQVQQRRKVGL